MIATTEQRHETHVFMWATQVLMEGVLMEVDRSAGAHVLSWYMSATLGTSGFNIAIAGLRGDHPPFFTQFEPLTNQVSTPNMDFLKPPSRFPPFAWRNSFLMSLLDVEAGELWPRTVRGTSPGGHSNGSHRKGPEHQCYPVTNSQ